MRRPRPIALLALLPAALSAQAAPTRFALGAPTATITETFSKVVGVAELRDGRLVVGDSKEGALWVADPRSGTAKALGHQGDGPGEYRSVFAVAPGPGDTVFVHDTRGLRVIRIAPNGDVAGSVEHGMFRDGVSPLHGIDRDGRIYFESHLLGTEDGRPKRRMQHEVVRWGKGTAEPTTAATMTDHVQAMHRFSYHALPMRDAWVVAPDGRVGVIDATDYRLRWYRDGKVVSEGPRLPYRAVPILPADRTAYRVWRAANPAGGGMSSPKGGADDKAREIAKATALWGDTLFWTTKPAVVENGAWRSPGGDIWVERSQPSTATQPLIDVVTDAGTLRGTLLLPAHTRIIALRAGGIYLVQMDDDDMETLRRYPWPDGLR